MFSLPLHTLLCQHSMYYIRDSVFSRERMMSPGDIFSGETRTSRSSPEAKSQQKASVEEISIARYATVVLMEPTIDRIQTFSFSDGACVEPSLLPAHALRAVRASPKCGSHVHEADDVPLSPGQTVLPTQANSSQVHNFDGVGYRLAPTWLELDRVGLNLIKLKFSPNSRQVFHRLATSANSSQLSPSFYVVVRWLRGRSQIIEWFSCERVRLGGIV